MSAPRLAALFILLLTAGSAPLAAQQGQALRVKSSLVGCLAVRSSPASGADRLACLSPGTPVTGIGAAPYWRQLLLADGTKGWSAARYLESAGPTPPATDTLRDDAWLEIHVVDVGQGDGIWIHTFDDGVPGNGRWEGKNIVIDGGPDASDGKNALLAYLQQAGHDDARIDALIISHPHDDHYPGAFGILRHFEVCEYYDSGYPDTGVMWNKFIDSVQAEKCDGAPITMHRGRSNLGTPDWGSEVHIEWLWAWPGSKTGLGSGNTLVNNASIVMKLTYGSQSILFMGDAEGKERDGSPDVAKFAEARILAENSAATLKATVLKLGHHGSETSSTNPLINAVDPDFVIVSSGRKSFSAAGTYLPDISTLHRFCVHKSATRIYRTDQDDEAEHRTTANDADGDNIIIRMNGKQTMVEAKSNGHPIAPTTCGA